MNGAQALAHTLVDAGVDLLFTNPGTSEMHFVAALDRVPGMRCVLTLFEGVATGAADGYFRLAQRPAGTLLHLGPGLANGLANLHNARKAHSGIVNVVGDHASAHLALDAPLSSDLPAVAHTMSHWVQTVPCTAEMVLRGRAAVAAAQSRPGQIATLILPADKAWSAYDGAALADTAALDSHTIGALLASLIPEDAIVVDEAVTTGRGFDAATRHAAPHDWLTIMGGSIGYGLPVAVGAAMAAPGRKVVALEGDGSAMYTLQALWTMARENLDVTVIVFANRSYKILHHEFTNTGAGVPGVRASDMLTLDRPNLDWCALAKGHGVAARRASNVAELRAAIGHALASGGPSVIEALC